MSEVDDTIARAAEVMDRTRAGAPSRARAARAKQVGRRLGVIAAVNAVILLAAVVAGLFVPLGMFGALFVMLLMIAVTAALLFAPAAAPVKTETLARTPLRALPLQTGAWLDRRRPALPAPAQTLADQIGVRLETLAPQLTALDDGAPVAQEVRKLIGEQLPELIEGYGRVPAPLRTVPRNGRTPDQQLADGLRTISGEIAALTEQLAQGDLDGLQTRERFLQIRYQGDAGTA